MELYEKVQMDKDVPLRFNVIEINSEEQNIIHKHWHRSVEILIPIEGKFDAWISGKNVEVNEGDVLIINSREIHSIYGEKNKNYKGYMIQISYEFLIDCFKEMDSIYFEQISNKNIAGKIKSLVEKIRICYESEDEHKKVMIEGILLMIVHSLLSFQKRKRHEGKLIESDKNKKRIISITEYIEKNYEEELTVEEIANKFNLSYGHFVRLFKENLNMTVKEYITNIRINKCREDLINTDYPIVQIALHNGFPNIQSFYKEFKKIYNITPAKFRKISQINK